MLFIFITVVLQPVIVGGPQEPNIPLLYSVAVRVAAESICKL